MLSTSKIKYIEIDPLLADSPLRTSNTNEADLLNPPMHMAFILASNKDGNISIYPCKHFLNRNFHKAPVKQPRSCQHNVLTLYRQNCRAYSGMKHWNDRMLYMIVIQFEGTMKEFPCGLHSIYCIQRPSHLCTNIQIYSAYMSDYAVILDGKDL